MRRLLTLLLGLIFASSAGLPAMAAGEQFYDKGRAESMMLGNTSTGQSTFVISTSAVYYPIGGWGRERIRVWGRNATIRQLYPVPSYTVSGITQANLRFVADCSMESRCGDLAITATDPGASGNSHYWEAIFYDILGYKGIPTSIIQAIISGFSASTAIDQPNWHDWTVVMNAGYLNTFADEVADLPPAISYSDADGATQSEGSGLGAKFQYNLSGAETNFRVWPQGMVFYLVWRRSCDWNGTCNLVPFRVESGAAGVIHTVNTR